MAFIRKIDQGTQRVKIATIPSLGYITLDYIPLRRQPSVTTVKEGTSVYYTEIFAGSPSVKQFKVDYFNGTKRVYFNAADVTTEVTISYQDVGDKIIANDVNELQEAVEDLQTDISGLQTNVDNLQTDVSGLQTNVDNLQTNVNELQEAVEDLQTDVSGLQTNVNSLQVNVDGLQTDFTNHTHNGINSRRILGTNIDSTGIDVGRVLTADGTGGTIWGTGIPSEITDIPTVVDPSSEDYVLTNKGDGTVEWRRNSGSTSLVVTVTLSANTIEGDNIVIDHGLEADAVSVMVYRQIPGGYTPRWIESSGTVYIEELDVNKIYVQNLSDVSETYKISIRP